LDSLLFYKVWSFKRELGQIHERNAVGLEAKVLLRINKTAYGMFVQFGNWPMAELDYKIDQWQSFITRLTNDRVWLQDWPIMTEHDCKIDQWQLVYKIDQWQSLITRLTNDRAWLKHRPMKELDHQIDKLQDYIV
jgi:hypothetical protein